MVWLTSQLEIALTRSIILKHLVVMLIRPPRIQSRWHQKYSINAQVAITNRLFNQCVSETNSRTLKSTTEQVQTEQVDLKVRPKPNILKETKDTKEIFSIAFSLTMKLSTCWKWRKIQLKLLLPMVSLKQCSLDLISTSSLMNLQNKVISACLDSQVSKVI